MRAVALLARLVAQVALFLLAAAPIGVLFGANAIEMAVVAIAGVGFAVLYLALAALAVVSAGGGRS